MHYQFILISTITTVAFAAPAPPNFRPTNTDTTVTNLTLPIQHIGVPQSQFSTIPISIPQQRSLHRVDPNRPAYTPLPRPGSGAEPGRNPLFARSQKEDKAQHDKQDDVPNSAMAAMISGLAETIQKQQRQRRDDSVNQLYPGAPDLAGELVREVAQGQQHARRGVDAEDLDPESVIVMDESPIEARTYPALEDLDPYSDNALVGPGGGRNVMDHPLQQKEGHVRRDDGDDEEHGIVDILAGDYDDEE